MSWTPAVQTAFSNDESLTGSSVSASFANPIAAGSIVSGMVEWENDFPGPSLLNVTDDKGNSTYVINVDAFSDATNGEAFSSFYAVSFPNGLPTTIIANFSGSSAFFAINVKEDSPGASMTVSLDGHAGQLQTLGFNATTTNGLSSGSATTTANGDLINGFTIHSGGDPIFTAGTSPNAFTSRVLSHAGSGKFSIASEDFIQTTAGNIAATFGQSNGSSGNTACGVLMLAFKAVASGVALTGAGMSSAAGSFSRAIAKGITGAGATASAGTLSAGNNATVGLTGAAAATAAGVFAETVIKALTGAAMAAAAQGVDEAVVVLASGTTAMAASAGTLGPVVSDALSGASAAASAGSLAKAVAETLPGAPVAASAGTFSVSAGNNDNVSLPGAVATASAGSFANAVVESLPGAAAVASAGTISATAGTSAALSGASMASAAGAFANAIAEPLSGVSAAANAGQMSALLNAVISGAAATAGAGSFANGVTVAPTGAQVAALAGFLTASTPGQAGLFGAFAQMSAGIIAVSAVTPPVVSVSSGDGGKSKKYKKPKHSDWPIEGLRGIVPLVSNPVDTLDQAAAFRANQEALRAAIRNAGKPKAALLSSASTVAFVPLTVPAARPASPVALAKVTAALAPAPPPPSPVTANPALPLESLTAAEAKRLEEEALIEALLLVA